MINTSNQYKNSITNDRTFIRKATVTLVDGTVLEFDDDNIMSFKYEDSVSSDNSFDIGSAIINKFTLQVDNTDEAYSDYDFYGAVIRPTIGLVLPDGTTETLKKGVYTVDTAKTPGATVLITALDNLSKFDRDYDSTLTYPATLAEIVRDACSRCGVTLNTPTFTNSDYTVKTCPEKMTYREAISYAAQIAGCFARCNYNGQLELKWYDFSVFETNANLDGGNFKDYTSGDTADGGNFDDYSSGDNYDGGTFDDMDNYHHIYSLGSQDICTDDVVITGIKVTEDSEDATSYLYGSEGYVLAIESNPFVQEGQGNSVAAFLGQKIVGIRFRPLTVTALSDPSAEAGDMAYVSDRKGNAYQCPLTNVNFIASDKETYKCGAETPTRNSAVRYSAATKAIVAARQLVEVEKTAREQAIEELNTLLDNASGLFPTYELQPDGSNILYLHDKKTLAESQVVLKLTSEAFGISNDGGKTYQYGFTFTGDAILRLIYAVGINADYVITGTLDAAKVTVTNLSADRITAGVIRSKDGNSYWDLDNSVVNLNGYFVSESGGYRAKIASGGSGYYYEDNYTGSIGAGYWASDYSKRGLSISTYKDYIATGISPGEGETTASVYIMNNGLNPSGKTERHLFYGTTRLTSNVYCDQSIYWSNDTRIGPGTLSGVAGTYVNGSLYCTGSIDCKDAKLRVVDTENYGKVGMNAFETMGAYFSDIGSGSIEEGGGCYVYLDPVFLETTDPNQEIQVFITKTNNKEFEYVEKQSDHFIVHGEDGLTFDWQVIAKQRGYQNNYGERIDVEHEEPIEYDDSIFIEDNAAVASANEYLENYYKEIEDYV